MLLHLGNFGRFHSAGFNLTTEAEKKCSKKLGHCEIIISKDQAFLQQFPYNLFVEIEIYS
jgi:hypothetical protein